MNLQRTDLLIYEVDEPIRRAERAAAMQGGPESHMRHAMARVRGGHDPFHVASELLHKSPETHARIVSSLEPDSPLRANFEAAKHVGDYYHHHAEHMRHYDDLSKTNDERSRVLSQKHMRKREIAHAKMLTSAKAAGRPAHEFLPPREGESGIEHRSRLLKTLGGAAYTAQPRNRNGKEHHPAYVHDSRKDTLKRGVDAVKHWYGKTHDIEHQSGPIARTRRYVVTKKQG